MFLFFVETLLLVKVGEFLIITILRFRYKNSDNYQYVDNYRRKTLYRTRIVRIQLLFLLLLPMVCTSVLMG